MNTGSVSFGHWFGISVRAHWSVAVIAVVVGSSLARQLGVAPAIVAVMAFMGSILVHELSHALTARRFGVDTESIQLWALGGVARLRSEAPTARAEGWIAVAGPLASLGLACIAVASWLALGGTSDADVWAALVGLIGILNAAVAIFNLLPGAPLDGGRILRAVRWAQHGDRYRAAAEAGQAGVVLGWLMALVGLSLIVRGQSGIWLLLTGVFILATAKVEISAAAISSRLAGVKVRDLTWFGVAAADGDLDADSMLWDRRRLGAAGGVAVVDDVGTPEGIVLEDQLWAVPSEQRPWVVLAQLMVPFNATAQAGPDDDLAAILPRLDLRSPFVTVWDQGRLVGLVPPDRLRERLRAAGL